METIRLSPIVMVIVLVVMLKLSSMTLNPDKCHIFIFEGEIQTCQYKLARPVTESVEEKLLGVILDKNLDFKSHVNAICKKAGQKLHALACIQIT